MEGLRDEATPAWRATLESRSALRSLPIVSALGRTGRPIPSNQSEEAGVTVRPIPDRVVGSLLRQAKAL
jgi:hypothetical protein